MTCILHSNTTLRPVFNGEKPSAPKDIPLDQPWKKEVFEFTRDHLQHPAWGLAHAERDYLLGCELAEKSGMQVDKDVMFAASFLHDMGGFPEFAKPGVDHAERSAEICDQVLRPAGFPEEKLEAVRSAISTHSYYSKEQPETPEALVLHDADTLDFLGAIGTARILAITGQEAFTPDLPSSIHLIENLADNAPGSIKSGDYAKEMAGRRLAETRAFLAQLKSESFEGNHL